MSEPESEAPDRPEPLARLGESVPELPAELEARVVASLRSRNSLGPNPPARRSVGLAIAGIAAILAAFWVGRVTRATPEPGGGTPADAWMLMLYEDASYQVAPPSEEAARVAEYRGWAETTPGVTGGAELGPEARMLEPIGPAEVLPAPGGIGAFTGYFTVRAASLDAALAIAARCPHLRHGGRIVVRPIRA